MARKTNQDQTPDAPEMTEEERQAQAQAAEEAAKMQAEAEAREAAELDFIASPVLLSPELVKQTAPQNARSPKQVKMDETVQKLHETWKRAGGPSTWGNAVNAKVVATYFIDPENSADHKKLITKAANLHGVAIRWGTPFVATADLVAKHNLPENYTGREVISFFVKDRRPRATNGTDETAAQTDARTDDQQPEQQPEQ